MGITIVNNLTDQELCSTLAPYEFAPTEVQCESIRAYMALLLRWNKRISLTTVVDPLEILRFHFGESVVAASTVPIEKGRLADVGSGAGFPGLPLSIAIPDISVTLIESNAKKAAFLAEVARELKLARVDIIRKRMEDLPGDLPQFDYIAARALGGYQSLLTWSRSRLKCDGKMVLWLGDEESRILSADPSWTWRDPSLIPGSERRFILVGSASDKSETI